MTMPHLMNCAHSDDSWCLACVKALWERHNNIEVRPWGTYEVLLDAPDCKVKRIIVRAGQRLSLQRHEKRREVWTCVSGGGTVTIGPELQHLRTEDFLPGRIQPIPLHYIHRVQADSSEDLVFIEVQLGTSFEEGDIERFEDDFGRT